MSISLAFTLIVASVSLLTLLLVLRPLLRAHMLTAMVLIGGLVVLAAGLYRQVGTPLALDPAMVKRPETLEEAITQLERSRERFADHEGWVMLATTYDRAGRFPEARDTWAQVVKMVPDDPNFLAMAAEARAKAHPERLFDDQAVTMLTRALTLNAQHARARLFLGAALRQRGDARAAAATWEPLLADARGEDLTALRAEVDAARAEAGLPPLPPPAAKAGAITVAVSLDPDFASRVRLDGNATVFVIAREPGQRMPVAVERHPASKLPLALELDDGDSPMPTAKLSALKEVDVIARLSSTGDAAGAEGDPASAPVRVTLPAKGPVEVVIGAP